jgi:hypothetical protein
MSSFSVEGSLSPPETKGMNKLLILFAILFLAACGATPQDPTPSSDSVKQTRRETATGQPSGIDVKVTQNGKPLADWKAASETTGVGALRTGDDLSIELTSPDQKWVLSISVSGVKMGVYRLAALREAGKAMIILTGGDEAMMVRAHIGELKLDEVSENYCSGSFKGTGTDATGNTYTYEGKFSRVSARRDE